MNLKHLKIFKKAAYAFKPKCFNGIKEIVIESEKDKNISGMQMGLDKIDIKVMKKIPVALGEVDVYAPIGTPIEGHLEGFLDGVIGGIAHQEALLEVRRLEVRAARIGQLGDDFRSSNHQAGQPTRVDDKGARHENLPVRMP